MKKGAKTLADKVVPVSCVSAQKELGRCKNSLFPEGGETLSLEDCCWQGNEKLPLAEDLPSSDWGR
ncbi:MAG: hypothetical protein MJA29_02360, partial [Candidatus Omnitrophica bacterium]|nr:hypothetical protein [Candidatus Omnitrophota bacterium]